MAKVALTGGKLIKVGSKIGLHPSCCCASGGTCCEYNVALNYTVVYDGPEGVRTLSGLGPVIFDAGSIATLDCTAGYGCENPDYIGQKLVLNFTLLNTFPSKSYIGYIDALQTLPENPNGGVPCDEQKSIDGLTFNLVYCVGGVSIGTATATVTLNP
jgi:hypothetical protein